MSTTRKTISHWTMADDVPGGSENPNNVSSDPTDIASVSDTGSLDSNEWVSHRYSIGLLTVWL